MGDAHNNTLYEKELALRGLRFIAGVDEVGRGCLAGPVLAAAVILPFPCPIEGITDSKKLSSVKREELSILIHRSALAIGFGLVEPLEIDRINILQASLKAMLMAVESLSIKPEYVLVDGHQNIQTTIPQLAIKRGDYHSVSIGAASIIAKVKRDAMMAALEKDHPSFSFSIHKGYGTAKHLEELRLSGPTRNHRRTFKGVMNGFRVQGPGIGFKVQDKKVTSNR